MNFHNQILIQNFHLKDQLTKNQLVMKQKKATGQKEAWERKILLFLGHPEDPEARRV